MTYKPTARKRLGRIRRKLVSEMKLAVAKTASALAPKTLFTVGAPIESFSILQEVEEKQRPGRIILRTQGEQKLGSDSMQILCRLKQDAQQPWPILWSQHSNVHLVSESLALLDEKKRIGLESIYGSLYLTADPAMHYVRLPKATRLAGPHTSVVSRWTPVGGAPNFSHWLLDALPRLAVLDEFPPDTKIIVPARLAAYQKETLKMLGCLDRIRHTPEKHLEIEEYYFSSMTTMVVCYNPYAVDFLRKKFLPHADPKYSGPKRFIIDRQGPTRGIANRDEFNSFLEKRGWGVIKTENLTFAQELKLFSEAEAIIGAVGSGFTNAIWCKPGTAVIQLHPESILDGSAEWISLYNRLRWRYEIFPTDRLDRAHVDLNRIAKLLKELDLD